MLVGLDLLLSGRLFLPEGVFVALAPNHLLESALLVVFLAVMTRGLHLDGFMDSCDALFGSFDRARRLEIMRDPHVGAFAVVGVVCLLIIKCAAVAGALCTPSGCKCSSCFHACPAGPCCWSWNFTPTRAAKGWARLSWARAAACNCLSGFVCALFASLLAAGLMGLILLLAASLIAWIIGAWASGRLGGLTGDVYGAVNEIVETAVLVLACLLPAGFFHMAQLSW